MSFFVFLYLYFYFLSWAIEYLESGHLAVKPLHQWSLLCLWSSSIYFCKLLRHIGSSYHQIITISYQHIIISPTLLGHLNPMGFVRQVQITCAAPYLCLILQSSTVKKDLTRCIMGHSVQFKTVCCVAGFSAWKELLKADWVHTQNQIKIQNSWCNPHLRHCRAMSSAE